MTKSPLILNLIQADEYYEQGIPYMTDTEYDIAKENARKLYPNDLYFKTVGAKVDGGKIKLPYVLGSLDKKKIDNIDKWLADKGSVVVTHKLDGVSFMATWEEGQLTLGATRGDGEEGQDITHVLTHILPNTLKEKVTVSLRGELIFTGYDHKELGFKNRRNGVSGLISKDDIDIDAVKKLKPVFYEVLECENDANIMYEDERLKFIEKLGLNVVKYIVGDETGFDANGLAEILLQDKTEIDYDIDGLVITKNNSVRENVLYPENKIAFKVNTDAVHATVTEVEWKLGRTGKVVPLVHIEPIELDGVTISKATGFNYDFIIENKITKGSVIGIIRAGQVIPYITEVFENVNDDLNIPHICPSCGSILKINGVHLVCDSNECYDMKVRQIAHFFKTLGAEFFTETTVRNLGIENIESAYELDELDIATIEGFGIKKAEQIFYEIQKTLTILPEKLLAAFGISGIGNTLSPVILARYGFDELFTVPSIEGIEGIGEILSKNLVENINRYKPLYEFLKQRGLRFIENEKSNITGMTFTLTGKMPMKRDNITKMIVQKGGRVSNISKTTNYLVTDDTNSGSIKNQKAASYGTKIINFNDLLEMLK